MRQWAGIPSSSSISVSGIWNMGPIRSLVTGVIVKRWLKPRKWFEWAFNRRSGCRRTHVQLRLRFSVQGLTNASCLQARCFRFPGHLLIGSRPLTSCLKHHGRQTSKCCQSQLDSTGAIKQPVTFFGLMTNTKWLTASVITLMKTSVVNPQRTAFTQGRTTQGSDQEWVREE